MRQETLLSIAKQLWENALCTEVKPGDNFFDLGGTSLLASQVIFQLAARVGLDPEPIYYALYNTKCLDEFSARLSPGIAGLLDEKHVARSITAANGSEPVRLSFAQERLWFIEQMNPGAAVYHIPLVIRIRTPLDNAVLRSAVEDLVARHESLRTRVGTGAGGVGYQVIDLPGPVAFTESDLSHLEPGERESSVEQFLTHEAARPFDLIHGPLFRVGILKAGLCDHVFYMTMHHLISDAWSVGVIIRDLAELYHSRLEGRPSALPALQARYSDYASWQRERLQGQKLEQLLDYWTKELSGAPMALELPADHPRPPLQSFRGDRLAFPVDGVWAEQLEAIGGEQGATLFMVALAAFSLILSRYSAQEDLLVGLPIANRGGAEVEGLVGLFINTLVIRADLSGNPSFRTLLSRVRKNALGAYAHQELPLEKLVEALQPARDLSRQPLFQVMLNFADMDASPIEIPDGWEPAFGRQRASKFDLTLYFDRRPDSMLFEIEYASDLFERSTVERFAGHFKRLLEEIASDVDKPISCMSLLTEREQRQLISEWKGTSADYPVGALIQDLFVEQAERTPDAIAVMQNGGVMTYAELDRRSNQLACYLRALGVGLEAPVGVYMERSFEWAISLLAILKAGGCYAPLDLSYPSERLNYMIRQAMVRTVLTRAALRGRLKEIASVDAIDLDTNRAAISEQSGSLPSRIGSQENLAYILFTSGSTGRPKGVMIQHRGFVSYLRQMSGVFSIGADDAVLQVTSTSFDPSLREFFATLSSGGRLVLLDSGESGDPAACLRLIQDGSISKIIGVTPTMLKMIIACPGSSDSSRSRLDMIFPSGEILERALCIDLWKTFGQALKITNIYGPTETTLTCCALRISPQFQPGAGTAPIGRPIANAKAYVLDQRGELLPVGIPGELYIGGVGLGRGYVGQPELTAERFAPDPFCEGERLYRTGDRVRWLADGALEFLGRVDHQVKIRGYRIELGETESVIGEHPEVQEAVVAAWEDAPGEKRLVGYVIWHKGASADIGKLRHYLRQRLPEYMIPSSFVALESLPLTPNRKVDRRALPAPKETPDGATYVAPRTPDEELLAGIWAEALQVERVGVNDNFFDLGGHSLLATRMIAHVQHTLKIDMSLRDVFEKPTIAELARRGEEMRQAGAGAPLPPLKARARTGRAPLSFAQERLWFLEQLGMVGAAYNMPMSMRLQGALDVEALERSFGELVERHESLRTRFETIDGEGMQVIDPAGEFKLEVIDLSHLGEEERESEARRCRQEGIGRPFDLARGPLLRVRLLRLGDENHHLLVTMHHIISDGWSLGVFVRELGELYRGRIEGRPARLPELAIQYADYAQWQREWLKGEELERQSGYWRERLAGAPVLELPTDRVRPAAPSFRGAAVGMELSGELTAGLERIGREEGATLYMALLSGMAATLGRWSGQDDLVIGSPIAGRKQRETEGLIGLFANVLALRVDLSGEPSFRELLRRVKDVTLGAYAHQDTPFEQIVAELQPERDLSRQPLFQVAFALQNLPPEELKLPGLKLFHIEREHVTSKFDLAIALQETSGGLSGVIEYATDLFDDATAVRFTRHWKKWLEGATANSESDIWELPLLSEEERRQALEEWNETEAEYPRERCVHELFAEQAQQRPDAVAVVNDGEQISYRELDERSSRLGDRLRELGVGAEEIVGLCARRSVEMVVGLLGILKAGGGYLPLDPEYPKERLKYMVEDARARVLVTEPGIEERLSWYEGEKVCVGREPEETGARGVGVARHGATAENTAYVIYTSGSTGRPKGVSVFHRNIVRLVRSGGEICVNENDVALHLAPLSFDASTYEIWGALLNGARLELYPHELVDIAELREVIEKERVSVLWLTAGLFQRVVEDSVRELSGVRMLLAGGDALSAPHVRRVVSEGGGCRMINGYGPTECTTFSAWYEVKELGKEARTTPIGRPVPNGSCYVLDERANPAPVGVVGELYLGGDGLGRGYLGRPELTGERFAPNPYGKVVGERLYRTGDQVRWRSDGNLEFVGRKDNQVKIRGYRIEPGEVESALRDHPEVREAVVTTEPGPDGNKRLIGYVVPNRWPIAHMEGEPGYGLPNGLTIVHQNKNETDFLYREIFEEQIYLRHGIRLPDNACVVDVGANIGLFTLFVNELCPRARIYAFEPIIPVFEKLRANSQLCTARVKLFPIGLADQERTAQFTYYPRFSMMSGRSEYADSGAELETVKRFLHNEGSDSARQLLEHADELFHERFQGQALNSQLRRLADVIREEKIGRIDLLKIDVERSEMDVVRGLESGDWEKIQQIVIEVHDRVGTHTSGRLEEMVTLLKSHGYEVIVEEESQLKETGIYNLYAKRPGASEYSSAEARPEKKTLNSVLTIDKLREWLQAKLPHYMIPSAFILMEKIPLTANGKVARNALPSPKERPDGAAYVAPRTPDEELLAGIWAEVLQVERVGVNQNFFDLGGHSLLATRMIAHVQHTLKIDVPLRDVFEKPTIAELARRGEEMRQAGAVAPLPPLKARARAGPAPLSFAQERLWFLEQLGMVGAAYNMPMSMRLQGALDVEALERSFGELVERQGSLRTRFETIDGQGMQVIDPAGEFKLEVIDLSHLGEEGRENEARRWMQEEIERPFDLARGPLLRVRLLRLGDEDHHLLVTMHHIISDGWSLGLLARELGELYRGRIEGRPARLPELAIQYADYAQWQREWLKGEELERQLEYWRERLAGAPVLELPTDRVRPTVASFRGAAVSMELSGELTAGLERIGREEGATLYMTLLSGMAATLGRWSGQDDLVIGSPIAGRRQRETEGLIGLFANVLALRVDLSGGPSFRELLRRVKDVTLGAYGRQDTPFEKVVEAAQPRRDLSRQPLFQAVFALQNAPQEELRLPGARLRSMSGEHVTSAFDLAVYMSVAPSGLHADIEYATDLFDGVTIERLMDHWRRMLESVAANANSVVKSIDILGPEEKRRILEEWNETAQALPQATLPGLFEERVEHNPDAVAVVFEEESLSYGELNRRANQLAQRLHELGVKPDARVAICMERSLEMVVALLATLKVGGAYVPLDPAYPRERLAYMLEDSAPSVLLTHDAAMAESAGHSHAAPILNLESDVARWADRPEYNPDRAMIGLSPRSLAYIIYTSGSTGLPKGAMNEHRGVVNRILWMQRAYGLAAGDAVLQKTPFSFDVSVWEFFWPLLYGARLVMARPEGHKDPGYLAAIIQRQKITTTHFVPSMLQSFLEHHESSACRSLARVVCSGEALPASLAQQFYKRLPNTDLHNLYGPTEAAVDVTFWDCRAAAAGAGISIGRPIDNTRIYILDSHSQPAPVRAPGELYIGGAQVGRGYFNRPELTAERFLPDPFSLEAGERTYKTGDIGRWLPDGRIEFLGRNDFQVKIHGFRIELGEIEAALLRDARVGQAVVVAREDHPMYKRLVGYVVPSAGQSIDPMELRRQLTRSLPGYMAPTAIVVLESFSLTPNGKVDRKALPAPEGRPEGVTYVAPLTPMEKMLAEIWAEVLHVKQVGIYDDFFELGGHSLMVTSVLSRVRSEIGIEVPLRSIFEAPTLTGFAGRIQAIRHLTEQSNGFAMAAHSEEMYEEGII